MDRRCSTIVRFAVGILIGTFGAAAAMGQPASPLEGLLPPAGAPERPRLLVLRSGQVIEGAMEAQVGGYMVTVPNGRMLITYDQVWVAAGSRADAYARMRDNLQNPSTNDRLELARWCYRQGLAEEARIELTAALKLEPDRPESRQLLQRVEASLQRQAGTEATIGARNNGPARVDSGTRPIAGELMAEWVQAIQPTLMNRCGNAACHGTAATNSFRLQPALGSRVPRTTTEANLAEVLKFINRIQPDESPLLTVSSSGSGPHRTAFQGRAGSDQQALLRRWVQAVGRDAGGATAAAPFGAVVPADAHPLVAAVAGPTIDAAAALPPSTAARAPLPPAAHRPDALQPAPSGRSVDEAFLRRILTESAPDVYDPDEFNRLVHGITAGTAQH